MPLSRRGQRRGYILRGNTRRALSLRFLFREEVERAVDGAESADAVENVVVDIAVVAHSGHVLLRLTEQAEVEAAVHIIVVCALALVVDHVHHRVHRDLSHP